MTKKEQILEYFKDINVAYNNSTMLDTLKHMLEDLEEVRHAQWHITDAYPHNVYCPECHTTFAQTHWVVWEDGSLPRNYCPACGAKMDELTMDQVKPSDKEFTLYADKKPIVTFKDSEIVLHGERKEDAKTS